ncbi:MAG: hypothetical protein WC314_04360 [Vulcanimicrobiota bacterium]
MDRERLEELLTGLLDDQLSSSERAELEQELQQSETARHLLESYRARSQGLKSLPTESLSEPEKAATKNRIVSTPASARNVSSLWWILGSVAACAAFFYSSYLLGPTSGAETWKLYLSDTGIATRQHSHPQQFVLSPASEEIRTLESETLNGLVTQGSATVVLECDGGTHEGQQLILRLSLDFDGDQQFELVQQTDPFLIDSFPGHEIVVGRFPPIPAEFQGRPLLGAVKLEFRGASLSGDGLNLQFRPEHSHLTLPVRASEVL